MAKVSVLYEPTLKGPPSHVTHPPSTEFLASAILQRTQYLEDDQFCRPIVFTETMEYIALRLMALFVIMYYATGYRFGCGENVMKEVAGLCVCTYNESEQLVYADCTQAPQLKNVPTFPRRLAKIVTEVNMTGTIFCNTTHADLPPLVICETSRNEPGEVSFLSKSKYMLLTRQKL